ncbi:hypothetical protein FACS189496_5560 [Bacilli bacterium]|nr:hypothetical protein FACS189496_5560 [Bacilli bacterium]
MITLFENDKFHFDIYVTGSNSKMLSTELGTELTGRHIDFEVFPIEFKHFNNTIILGDKKEKINEYMLYGGMGNSVDFYNDKVALRKILRIVLNDCIEKDIYKRHKIHNKPIFEMFLEYIFKHIGQKISVLNLSNFFKSNKISNIDFSTLLQYIK